MRLTVHTWGTGERTALLVHGMMADHRTWRRVGPALAERGYRVAAVDLRGHGTSPRQPGPEGARRYRLDDMAADLADSCPSGAELALGHSLGALVLQRAIDLGLDVGRAVFSDPAWRTQPHDLGPARAYRNATPAQIRAANPRWEDAAVADESACLALWDPDTVTALDPPPGLPAAEAVPSLVLLADPSERVPPVQQQALLTRGFSLRRVTGAGHNIHRDDFPAFMDALAGWV
ncbi:alpha/beta hydrolase [Streptomyces sp. CA-111067]|uniref:alpha/beta hydrolase n=1 Tax=Streptomyces sp. CA-111067 TaxID=3240046 RepID=UPI003D989667